MKKIKFTLEYQLNCSSPSVIWNSIGKPLGLAEWFSDGVTVKGNEYTFLWEDFEQTAILIQQKTNSFIRFQWIDDIDTDCYFEIKLIKTELSNNLALVITDFAEKQEIDDLKMLLNKQVEILRRKKGI